MPILIISRSRGRHIGLIFFFKIDKEPGPPNISDQADSHTVQA